MTGTLNQGTTPRTPTTVSILHHFVGDDSVAMDDLVDAVERELPNVNIEEIPDAQTSLRAKTDILRGTPPDIWDDWPGKNIIPYWKASVVDDITGLWEEAGFVDAFFESIQDAAMHDGTYYAVPMNVQRQNNLFYNVDVVREAGVDPERLPNAQAFIEALEQVEDATDAAGLMLPQKRPWPAFDLWDMLVLARSDANTYREIFQERNADRHREVIRDAFEILGRAQDHSPQDATYDSWQPSLKRFVAGEAAFFAMGDWAAGVLQNTEDFAYGEDWGSVPFPGTDGVYQVVLDSFMTPPTAENSEVARDVLRVLGSRKAIEDFTRTRGAVPPRRDASTDGHTPFFQQQATLYRKSRDQVMGTRGNGVLPDERVALITAAASFLAERDVEATTRTVVDAQSD